MQVGGGPPLDGPPRQDAVWTLVGATAAVLDSIDAQYVKSLSRREVFHVDAPGVAFADLDGALLVVRITVGIMAAADAAILMQGAEPQWPRTSSFTSTTIHDSLFSGAGPSVTFQSSGCSCAQRQEILFTWALTSVASASQRPFSLLTPRSLSEVGAGPDDVMLRCRGAGSCDRRREAGGRRIELSSFISPNFLNA